jgi:hypothetical protein
MAALFLRMPGSDGRAERARLTMTRGEGAAMKTTWKSWAAVMMAAMGMIPLACTSSVVGGPAQPTGCPTTAPAAGSECSAAPAECSYASGPCTVKLRCDLDVGAWQSETMSCLPAAKDCLSGQDGDVCATVGETCAQSSGPCDLDGLVSICGEDHHWHFPDHVGGEGCCPHSAACPASLPAEGDPCDPCVGAQSCGYPSTCGQNNTAICQPEGAWHLFAFGDCPPPPPPDYCTNNADQSTCETDPACRWLTPGCGETPLLSAGCFTNSDCAPGSCDPSQTCQTFSYDPCFGKGCDACGAPASLCIGGL